MGAQLLWVSMVFVDSIMVGRLGAEALGSIAMAGTINGFFYVFSIGILSSMGPIVSHAFGAVRPDEIGRAVRQGFRVAIVLSVFQILMFQLGDVILRALGQQEALIPVAHEYLQVISWGIPAQVGFVCLRQYTEAIGDSLPSVIVVGIGALLNVILDPILIFGFLGFPRLEVAGAAYATAILSWVMFFTMLFYVTVGRRYQAYGLWKGPWRTDWKMIGEILRIGVPASGSMLSEMTFFGATTLIIGTMTASALASHQIAINAASFLFMIPLGLSFAVSIRIGQTLGAGNRKGAEVVGTNGYILVLLLQSMSAVLFLFFPELIVRVYTNDLSLMDLAVSMLRIAGIFQLVDGLQVVGIGILRGMKDTKVPFLASLFAFWLIGFPLSWYLSFHTTVGAKGCWWGMVVGLSLASALHYFRFRHLHCHSDLRITHHS